MFCTQFLVFRYATYYNYLFLTSRGGVAIILLYLTRIWKYGWKFSTGFIFRIWNVMLLSRQFKLLLINQIQKTIFLHGTGDLHTHTQTHRIYIVNEIMEQSPSWEAEGHLAYQETPHLSWDQRFITLPTTAHRIWEPVSHLEILRFFNWQTVKPYGEPIPYSFLKETINFEGYLRQIFHSFFWIPSG